MKVELENNYKDIYTITDFEHAKKVIEFEKEEDGTNVKDWAQYAVTEAVKLYSDLYSRDIIMAKATTSKNRRIYDAYGEGTGDMDVWIEALAETSEGYIKVGAYLSDIWQTGSSYYAIQMQIQRYKEV